MDSLDLINALDRYANLDLEYPRWMSGDNADEGPSYCLECAEKALAEGLGEWIGGGIPQECDTFEQCYTCCKMLEHSLTDHGAEREYSDLKFKRFKNLDKETAYIVARILESDPHNKKYIRLAERAAAKIKTKEKRVAYKSQEWERLVYAGWSTVDVEGQESESAIAIMQPPFT